MNINFSPFFSSGYVHTTLPEGTRKTLDDLIWSADRTKKTSLSGIQTDNWLLPEATPLLGPVILELVKTYKDTHKELTDEYEQEVQKIIRPKYNFDSLSLETMWVNVTEKYMYNPTHNNQGV